MKKKCVCHNGEKTSCANCGKKYVTVTPKLLKLVRELVEIHAYDRHDPKVICWICLIKKELEK